MIFIYYNHRQWSIMKTYYYTKCINQKEKFNEIKNILVLLIRV